MAEYKAFVEAPELVAEVAAMKVGSGVTPRVWMLWTRSRWRSGQLNGSFDTKHCSQARQRVAMDTMLEAESESLARLEALKAAGGESSPPPEDDDDSAWDAPGFVKVSAPFTASVWTVSVQQGQEVAAGDTLLVLEAMKMETPVAAPCAGTVAVVKAVQSTLAPSGQLLVVIKTA
jgi:biotin carboxyl carrier protein